jgi:PAS domain S-box-containing protein
MASEAAAERLLMRWAASGGAAGPRADWPATLRVLARLMLDSSRPMFIAWGPQLALLYNDAFIDILGERHPAAFGQPLPGVWAEAWPAAQPFVDRVMAGEPVEANDFSVELERQGRPAQTHFSFSFSPIRESDGAPVMGFFCTCVEVTQAVQARQVQADEMRRRLSLFKQAPGFICVLGGPEHRFEFVNDAYEAMMGKRDVIGKTAREVFPEVEEQGLFALLEQVYTTGERFVARAMPMRIGGSPGRPAREAIFDFVWEPLREADGSVSGIFAMGYDVTPAAAARRSVDAAERRYGELLDTMGEGFIVLDENFRVVQINAEGLRIDGRPRAQLLGRTHWELWPAANGTQVEAAYRRVMQRREPEDLRHHYVGGGLDLWMRIRIYPVSGGVASLYRDITEIVLAEEALQHSNERFKAAIAAIGVLWTNDADGRMVGEQPGWAQLTGQTRQAYEGYGWASAVHPEDSEPTLRAWNEAVRSRSTFVFEHRVRRRDGQWRRFSIRAVPIVEVTARCASGSACTSTSRKRPRPSRPCVRRTARRTSSSPRWPTSCATRWRPSAPPPTCCRIRSWRRPSSSGAASSSSARRMRWRCCWTTCWTWPASPAAGWSCGVRGWRCASWSTTRWRRCGRWPKPSATCCSCSCRSRCRRWTPTRCGWCRSCPTC